MIFLRALWLSLLLSMALAATAQADDHRMQVSEVHPSATDPGMAFVELHDAVSEPFPEPSYTLASLDASGAILGRQIFNPQIFNSPFGYESSSQRFLVGGSSRQPRHAALTIPLTGSRKVCFYRGSGTSDVINCLTYGEVPAGQSAQRTSSGAVIFACPTPDTANLQTAEPCPGAAPAPNPPPAPGAAPAPGRTPALGPAAPASGSAPTGVPPAPTSTQPVTADTRAPGLTVASRRVQRLARLRLGVAVNERATVTVSGSVRVAAQSFALVEIKRSTPAGTRATLKLKLTRKGTKAVRGALRQGARLKVTVRVAARDLAGNVSVKKLTITMRS